MLSIGPNFSPDRRKYTQFFEINKESGRKIAIPAGKYRFWSVFLCSEMGIIIKNLRVVSQVSLMAATASKTAKSFMQIAAKNWQLPKNRAVTAQRIGSFGRLP